MEYVAPSLFVCSHPNGPGHCLDTSSDSTLGLVILFNGFCEIGTMGLLERTPTQRGLNVTTHPGPKAHTYTT